ncbi:hypothetical protein E3N88_34671 [Mikania micrantha]|uniref:Uncharacterized protein n=1 Tax=Mikania micrantha TaxID=192012 RepID=A0A5N6LZ18_9ASTR|nr:hypothetical protein E3N88_34671 [Mikania micrantha]
MFGLALRMHELTLMPSAGWPSIKSVAVSVMAQLPLAGCWCGRTRWQTGAGLVQDCKGSDGGTRRGGWKDLVVCCSATAAAERNCCCV